MTRHSEAHEKAEWMQLFKVSEGSDDGLFLAANMKG